MMLRALLVPLLVTGCGTSINATALNPSPVRMTARPAKAVELYTLGAPTRPHVDVALLEAEEGGSFTFEVTAEMLGDLRERAGKMGCDAIVIGSIRTPDPIQTTGNYNKGIVGTCIVYL